MWIATGKEAQSATLKKVTLVGSILLGFQRFISSDIFDYFALMSDFGGSFENRLPEMHGGAFERKPSG